MIYRRPSLLVRIALGKEASVLEALESAPWWSIVSVTMGPGLALLAYWLSGFWAGDPAMGADALTEPGRIMLGVFVLAASYWITGAIPPFATALLVMGLQVFLLGLAAERAADLTGTDTPDPGAWGGVLGWEQFVSPAAAPVVVLMLGGMILGEAAHKHGIDRALAGLFLRPFAKGPGGLVLGVILVTALFSMWMSNTATAAMMIAMMAPIVTKLGPGSRLGRALIMAVPVGANLGGMGTPIGTPPNALAFGALRAAGEGVTFLSWMVVAIPATVVMLAAGWAALLLIYRPASDSPEGGISGMFEPPPSAGWRQLVVAGTFTMVVILWVTSAWTGIPAAPVAILPVIIFTATRLIDRHDLKRIDWDVLLLVAGGLALGGGMQATGLASWMILQVPTDQLLGLAGGFVLLLVVSLFTVVFSTLMSNTAVANLVLPIALGVAAGALADDSIGPGAETGIDLALGMPAAAASLVVQMGFVVALSASLSMALPVSTPPNAMAAGTGRVGTADFVGVGLGLGVVGVVVVLAAVAMI